LQEWRLVAALPVVLDALSFKAVDLLHSEEGYESDNNKVKYALKEDPVSDGGSSRRFGCGERFRTPPVH